MSVQHADFFAALKNHRGCATQRRLGSEKKDSLGVFFIETRVSYAVNVGSAAAAL